MLAFIESIFFEALAISPEYLMLVGLPELPPLKRPKFIIIREPASRKTGRRLRKGA
ncbi:MAG: hypothetical protein ACMVO5_08230 [Polymorphobacter sp.]|uniref:hypothetical protein n=1 Tax=Polymorphobacter sp. TaxID=1909290 RepID=UPI003A885927